MCKKIFFRFHLYLQKGVLDYMIFITKDEAEYIRKHSKNVRIILTGAKKNKRQKKRYADETPETFRLLRRYHRG